MLRSTDFVSLLMSLWFSLSSLAVYGENMTQIRKLKRVFAK